ncbi:unnamed protein product [Camellia sinensis]
MKLSLSLARSLNFSFSTLDFLDCRSKTLDGLRFFDLCRSQSNSLAILHRSLSLEGFALAVLHRTRTRSVLHQIDPFYSSSNRFVLHQIADPKSKIDLAFVDSGAQSTIISKSCAERCGFMYIIISDAGQPLREELAKSPEKILACAFPEFVPKSDTSMAQGSLTPPAALVGEEGCLVSPLPESSNSTLATPGATSDAYF